MQRAGHRLLRVRRGESWRLRGVLTAGAAVMAVVAGISGMNVYVKKNDAVVAAARARVIQELLADGEKRAIVGACNDVLDDEYARAVADPSAAHPTADELYSAMQQPGSGDIPCEPSGTYSRRVGHTVVTVTIADVLPRTLGQG